jgi:hypothetical protein
MGMAWERGAMKVASLILAVLGAAGIASTTLGQVQPAAAPPGELRTSATMPAATTRGAKDELVAQVEDAIDHDGLGQLDAALSAKLVDAMSNMAKLDQEKLARLATAREFGRFFSRVATLSDEDRAALKWLAEMPKFSQTLMLALSPQDSPDNILSMVKRLQKDQHDAIEKIPDLATALCITADKPGFTPDNTEKPLDIDRPITELHYYMAAGAPGRILKFNLRELPWQLSVYVVDERLTFADLKLAADRYAPRTGLPVMAFWDVPYRPNAKYGDASGSGGAVSPPLGQLLLSGGTSVQQAYVGAQVSKVLGDPACAFKADDLSAPGAKNAGAADRSWALCLDGVGLHAEFNVAAARYPEYKGWPGSTIDPQTQESITEADVMVLAETSPTAIKARLASEALVKSADLVEKEKLLELYETAAGLSVGNRNAWFALADAASSQRINDQDAAALVSLVRRLLRQRQPDFAAEILRRAWQGRGTDEQLAEYDKIVTMFADRPDIAAGVLIAKGDVLGPLRPRDAAAAYNRAMALAAGDGPMVLEAMNRLDALMRSSNSMPDLLAAYRQAMSRLPAPAPTVYGDTTPFYLLGQQFAAAMEEAGNAAGAKQLRDQLGHLKIAPR